MVNNIHSFWIKIYQIKSASFNTFAEDLIGEDLQLLSVKSTYQNGTS
jgi:hypothetical protein